MTHDGKATGMTLTQAEELTLWKVKHGALEPLLRAVEAIVAARVAAVSAELTQARTQLAAIEALKVKWRERVLDLERAAESDDGDIYNCGEADTAEAMYRELHAALAVPAPTDTTTEAPTRCGCCDSRLNENGGCPTGDKCCDKPKEDA